MIFLYSSRLIDLQRGCLYFLIASSLILFIRLTKITQRLMAETHKRLVIEVSDLRFDLIIYGLLIVNNFLWLRLNLFNRLFLLVYGIRVVPIMFGNDL